VNVVCPIDYVVPVQQNLGKFNVTGFDLTGSVKVGPSRCEAKVKEIEDRYQQEKDGQYVDNVGRFTADNGAIPRWRHYLTFNWRGGPFGATLAQNFVLGYGDASGTRRVASYETWDAQGTWDAWKGLGVTLGIRNILDRDPPASDQGQTFQVGYDPRYTDSHGRTYYVGLKYAFK
jgi:iron complex outermembrane receptor protein